MKTNYHTHTQRCLHAQGTEEDYVRSALDSGVEILGFSDHAPFPDVDYGYRMPYHELETYFSAVDRLAKEHSSDIIIQKSLEIEYMPQYRGYYEDIITRYSPDYLTLGEHFFHDSQGVFHNITIGTDSTELYLSYARAVAEALKTGYFQVVAHPEIFTMNRHAWDRNCDAASEIIIEAAAQTGTVLEFNANGFRRGVHDYPDGARYMYPHPSFWKKAAGSGVPVIIGSDCHNPVQVWDFAMDTAREVLKELGITPIEVLKAVSV